MSARLERDQEGRKDSLTMRLSTALYKKRDDNKSYG